MDSILGLKSSMAREPVTRVQLLIGTVLAFLALLIFFPTQHPLVLLVVGVCIVTALAVAIRALSHAQCCRNLSPRTKFTVGNILLAWCCFVLLSPTLSFIFGVWLLWTERPLDFGIWFLAFLLFGLSVFSGYYLIQLIFVLLTRIRHKEDLIRSSSGDTIPFRGRSPHKADDPDR